MEDNKLNRRSRPRPYDLRRKVLLKNFLREQMTYIPHTGLTTSVQNNHEDFSVEPSSSSSELLDEDLADLDEGNITSAVTVVDNSASSENAEDTNLISGLDMDDNDHNNSIPNLKVPEILNAEPKLFKFSSIMKLRNSHKKKKGKGIVRAKRVVKTIKSPVKSKPFKSSLEKLLSSKSRTRSEKSSDRTTRSTSKILLSLFKSRKERSKTKEVEQSAQSSSCPVATPSSAIETVKSCTSDQSVQTDDNWSRKAFELTKVEKSNKLLKEENRLLSESLSYFMSSNSMDSHLNRGSPLQTSNRSTPVLRRYPGYYDDLSSCSSYEYNNNWNPRSRVLRSKSVQEHSERRVPYRPSHRTRSMNYHNNLSEFYAGHLPSTSYSSPGPYSNFPRTRKKGVLSQLPVSNCNRVVQRRSSMPERILSENDRSRVCRRSGSMRDHRTPFHSLPSEAFY